MKTTSHADAEATLRARLAEGPDDLETLVALADLLAEQSHDREAASLYRRALTLHDNDARALCGLGLILHAYGDYREEGIALLQRALAFDATRLDAYRPLAWALNESGRRGEAVGVVQAWCKADRSDPAAQHLLAAYSGAGLPERASDEFVRKTFDDGAIQFDSLLRESLHYRAPEALFEHLQATMPWPAARSLDVLDMGCGTGLCAPLLRPLSRRLVGVDLSAGMLERAVARSGYDELHCAELTSWLAEVNEQFDLLFAADTLLYFGDLGWILGLSQHALRPGGWFAFTVEALPDAVAGSGVELATTGRFRHSEVHLQRALAASGFANVQTMETRLRFEAGAAVMGFAVVAQRPAFPT